MRFPGFISSSYVAQTPWADCEDLINLYVEEIESPGATSKLALYPTPGVETVGPDPSLIGAGRAHWAANGREFAVIGTKLIEVNRFGVVTVRGTVAEDMNPATICDNGQGGAIPQLFITSGSNGYVYDLDANTLSAIANLAGKATMGNYLDGYFIALDSATGTAYISALLDGATWDPTDFFANSISSDDWISMTVANRYIYFSGNATTQVWYDAGTFPIPFAPHPSGLMQYGAAGSFAGKVVGSSFCWLSATRNGTVSVIRTSGFTPEVISTNALTYALSKYQTISDCIADSYEELGHTFLTLSFPTADASWGWDTKTGWHKRGTWDILTDTFKVSRQCFHAFVFGEHRILDLAGSRVYRMSSDLFYDVDSIPIRRVRRSPAAVDENNLLFYAMFELDLEPGLATGYTGQGSDPLVMLRYSDDNGKNWSAEIEGRAGSRGAFGTRLQWNRLGAGRRRVFEIAMSDPVPWRIVGAYVKTKQSFKARAA